MWHSYHASCLSNNKDALGRQNTINSQALSQKGTNVWILVDKKFRRCTTMISLLLLMAYSGKIARDSEIMLQSNYIYIYK